jgi:hypothetical protein
MPDDEVHAALCEISDVFKKLDERAKKLKNRR